MSMRASADSKEKLAQRGRIRNLNPAGPAGFGEALMLTGLVGCSAMPCWKQAAAGRGVGEMGQIVPGETLEGESPGWLVPLRFHAQNQDKHPEHLPDHI